MEWLIRELRMAEKHIAKQDGLLEMQQKACKALADDVERLKACLARHLDFHAYVGGGVIPVMDVDTGDVAGVVEIHERGAALVAETKELLGDEWIEKWRKEKRDRLREGWPFGGNRHEQ